MISNFKIVLNSFLLLVFLAGFAHAAEPERYTKVTITPQVNKVEVGQTIMMAITLEMVDDWHVYWANPGDSGLPIEIIWESNKGIEVKDINWPIPDKIPMDFLANYGYHDKVTLLQPITIKSISPKEKVTLTAKLNILVCKEICIPENDEITVVLNDPLAFTADNTALIDSAQALMPATMPEGKHVFREKDGHLLARIELNTGLRADMLGGEPEFFPLDWGVINHAPAPQVTITEDALWLVQSKGDQLTDDKESLAGLLDIKGQNKTKNAYMITLYRDNSIDHEIIDSLSIAPAEQSDSANHIPSGFTQAQKITFISALTFALLGGIILNLMPCVFPVLSMKALSLVKISEKEVSLARKHGLAYTAGILCSFLVIAGALIIFKNAGILVGWGFQLQNPVIVGALAYLLFLIGLNLMGFIEVSGRFGGLGQSLSQKAGLSGTFFTGVLAAIVATPCTAPFMAAAIGFALVQPAIISLSVFMALGFGLALPYLFLCYVPAACKILPRPGAWMDSFKQFLAFPMFASSIWLVWVLSEQKGASGVLYILSGMLMIVFCIWISKIQTRTSMKALKTLLFSLALIMPFLCLAWVKAAPMANPASEHTYEFGEKFSTEALNEALKGDESVFVEMTASWCITCKINHFVAINTNSTKSLFQAKKIRYFIGDWTNYDGEITKYLESFGRNGVPIYVYYPPADKETGQRAMPVLLPQVLTSNILKDAIENP